MNVVLYGATGHAGTRIMKELLARGHKVKTVVRNPAKFEAAPGVAVEQGDLNDVEEIRRAITGADAVISAYAPPADASGELVTVTRRQIEAVKAAGVLRLLVVGGAGSLYVAPGVQLVDAESFPAAWLPIALAHRDALEELKKSDINWTYLSPAAFLEPGVRSGKFRLGKDELIATEQGDSRISLEDYAVAMVDELEKEEHPRARFSVGY